jgi:hypothetical protein
MFVKKTIFLIFIAFWSTSILLAKDNFKIIEFKAPDKAAPGSKITCTVKMEAVSNDPRYTRPTATLKWGDNKTKTISPEKFVPWRFNQKQTPGTKLSVTFSLQIPETLKPGTKAEIIFRVFGKDKGKWIYATIASPNAQDQSSYKHTITIKEPETLDLASSFNKPNQKLLILPSIKAPVIDGKIDKSEWDKAAPLETFVNNQTGKSAISKTNGFIAHDGKNIYLAFICEEPAMDKISATPYPGRHDAPIWANDAIEIFFRNNINSTEYVQFIADTLNQHYDAYLEDFQGFNPVWESAVTKSENGWNMEVKIPLSTVSNEKVESGTVWQADFFREYNRGSMQSAWQMTKGNCNMINKFGFIIFNSAKAALVKATSFANNYKEDLNGASSSELQKMLSRLKTIKQDLAQSDEAKASENYFELSHELAKMKEVYKQLVFAAKHASSGSPLVIQQAEAFGSRPPERNNANLLTGLKASFLADETRYFAFNVTNISKKTVVFRCAFRYGNGNDPLRLGIPGFSTAWRTPTGVASADGTLVYDILPVNTSGTYTVAPNHTVQCFVSAKPEAKAPAKTNAFLVIQDIDGGKLEMLKLPVEFEIIPVKLADSPDKLFVFGWDRLAAEIARERPKFAKAHFAALFDNGFNVTRIGGLKHLPRPKADKDGNLIGKIDFSKVDLVLSETRDKADYYYIDIAIWEKNDLRRDLFNLDFYTPAYEKAFKTWLKLILAHLKSKGIPKSKLVICGYDESLDKRAQTLSRWIKEVDPELATLVDCSSNDMAEVKRMDKYINIWMPHFRTLNEEALKEFHKYIRDSGKTVMTYYYSSGGNEKTKAPHGNYILKFWVCYDMNLKGLGYWASGQYYADPYYRKVCPKVYDTSFMYPNENGVSPSRRLFAWNRGAEDFKLLKLSEAKLKKENNAEGLKALRKNVELVIKYPNDLSKAEAMRQFCREMLAK